MKRISKIVRKSTTFLQRSTSKLNDNEKENQMKDNEKNRQEAKRPADDKMKEELDAQSNKEKEKEEKNKRLKALKEESTVNQTPEKSVLSNASIPKSTPVVSNLVPDDWDLLAIVYLSEHGWSISKERFDALRSSPSALEMKNFRSNSSFEERLKKMAEDSLIAGRVILEVLKKDHPKIDLSSMNNDSDLQKLKDWYTTNRSSFKSRTWGLLRLLFTVMIPTSLKQYPCQNFETYLSVLVSAVFFDMSLVETAKLNGERTKTILENAETLFSIE